MEWTLEKSFVRALRPHFPYPCLQEDATQPDLSALERLALVSDRGRRIREIRRMLAGSHEGVGVPPPPTYSMEASRHRG